MSLNAIYPSNKQGRRFLSNQGKEYKKAIALATRSARIKQDFLPDAKFYKLTLMFGFTDFYTKDGRVSKKRPDCSNAIKQIEDSVCETIGINDNLVVKCESSILCSNVPEDFISITLTKI